MKFRACVSASANKCHIRKDGELLVLCTRCAPARDVSGDVPYALVCIECIKRMSKEVRAAHERGEHIVDLNFDGLDVQTGNIARAIADCIGIRFTR